MTAGISYSGVFATKGAGATISAGNLTVSAGGLISVSAESDTAPVDTLTTITLDSELSAKIPSGHYIRITLIAATGHTITLTDDHAALSPFQMAFRAGADIVITDTCAVDLIYYAGNLIDVIPASQVNGGFAGLTSPAFTTPTFTGLETAEGVYKAANINALATGQTALVPLRTGKRFIPTKATVELVDVAGAGTEASIRIGAGGSFDNAVPITALTGLDTQYELFDLTFNSPLSSVDVNAAAISIDVQAAATGFSTYTINVYLSGYYR